MELLLSEVVGTAGVSGLGQCGDGAGAPGPGPGPAGLCSDREDPRSLRSRAHRALVTWSLEAVWLMAFGTFQKSARTSLRGDFQSVIGSAPGWKAPVASCTRTDGPLPVTPCLSISLAPSNLAFPILGLQVHVGGAPSISGASHLAAEVWGSPLPSVLFFLTGLSAPRAFTQGSSQRPCPALGCVSNSATLWQHVHTPQAAGSHPAALGGGAWMASWGLQAEDSSDWASGGGWFKH